MALNGGLTDHVTRQNSSAGKPGIAPEISTLDHMLILLQAKDDTSRFVGLAILKSILDNQEALRNDENTILRCWAAVSPRFLDRLLRSGRSQNRDNSEKRSMVELAVAIIHTFTLLLPPESIDKEKMIGRTEGLLAAFTHSISGTTMQILQILITFSSGQLGAAHLLQAEDLSPLLEITSQISLALETLKFAFIKRGSQAGAEEIIKLKLNTIIPTLILGFRQADCSSLLSILAEIFPGLSPESFPPSTEWFRGLVELFHNTIITRPSAASRSSMVGISSILLRQYPSEFPRMLFHSKPPPEAPIRTTKPFTYIFISLILVDIRSSIPSVLELLNSPDYPRTSNRLAASYDLVTSFIGFLVQDLESEEDITTVNDLMQAPDLLLKLRKDIAETMSLTIELLRDRWDAAISGAAGLHPSARAPTEVSSISAGIPLSLTWDSANGGVSKDPLTLGAVRTLALWLREDDNDSLRSEAAGICDVLLSLFELENDAAVDFKQPVLMALEGILTTSAGIEAFRAADGWTLLATDLCKILTSGTNTVNGLDMVRVLLAFVESEFTGPSKEEWLELMTFCAELPPPPWTDLQLLELRVSVWQLVVELYHKAAKGVRARFREQAKKMAHIARKLEGSLVEGGGDHLDVVGIGDGLSEVIDGFEAFD